MPPVQPFSRKLNNFAGYNGILKSFTSVEYLFEIPETLKSRSGVRLSARLCKAWIQIARRVKFPRLQAIGKNMLTILLGEIQEGGGRLGKPELLYTAGAHHAASKSIILGCQAQANLFQVLGNLNAMTFSAIYRVIWWILSRFMGVFRDILLYPNSVIDPRGSFPNH